DTPFVLRLAEPCQMGILRIDRTSHYLYAAGFEFAQLFLKGMEFGGTNEREVHRIKEQYDVFLSLVLAERKVLYDFVPVDDSRSTYRRRLLSYQSFHIAYVFDETIVVPQCSAPPHGHSPFR